MTTTHDGDAPAGRGAVDDAIARMREAAAAEGRADGPGAAGSVDPSVLRTVLATLPFEDQQLLWDRHVRGRDAAAIAAELGQHARSVLHRLRRAEERLAAAFAAAHARACPPGCLDTRRSLHSYVRHRLSPVRRTVLEAHLFACQGCMRAFIDVREAGWAVRDAGPLLLVGSAAGGAPVVVGALGAGTAGAGVLAWSGPVGAALAGVAGWARALVLDLAHLGKGGLIAAGTVAGVAVAAVATAIVLAGGGGGAPADGPVAPAPTASVEAAAPDAAATPAAPADPEPDATTVPEDPPPAGETAHPGDAGPTGTPTAPATTPPTTPDTPGTTTPTTPGTTTPSSPSTTSPTTPTTTPTADPSPTTSPTGEPTPTSTPTTTPTSKPTTTPTPKPTPTPDPDPVRSTVRADVPGVRGLFRVTPDQEGVEIVSVSVSRGWLRAHECRDGSWYVSSRHYQAATVDVTVDAPADVAPSVSLVSTPIWRGWLKTC